jgi:hypothetical protein
LKQLMFHLILRKQKEQLRLQVQANGNQKQLLDDS